MMRPVPRPSCLRIRLSVHMFLTFAILSAWTTVLAQYLDDLGFSGKETALVLGCTALAGMIAPLVAGQLADRWLATERFLALSNLLCGLFLLGAWRVTSFGGLWGLSFGAALFYVISIPLGTSMAMVHLPQPARDFPIVRVWGTVGWVAAAAFFTVWQHLTGRGLADGYAIAGVLSLLNAAYSLTLPHTPPPPVGAGASALRSTGRLLAQPSLGFMIALLFFIQICAAFYYNRGPVFFHDSGVSREMLPVAMGVAQAAEIATMFALAFVYTRLGAKATIALGIAAWAIRFGIYGAGPPVGALVAAQALHAPGFAFVRTAASLYVEQVCPRELRGTAQGLLSCAIDGAGPFLGTYVAGAAADFLFREGTRWGTFWTIPAAASGAILVVFLAGFRAKPATETRSHGEERK